jgi:hypothetical protein
LADYGSPAQVLLYLPCDVGRDLTAEKGSLLGATPQSLNWGQIVCLQALPVIIVLAVDRGGHFLTSGVLDGAQWQSGESERIDFSLQCIHANQRDAQGESQSLSYAYAHSKSVEAPRAFGYDDRFHRS